VDEDGGTMCVAVGTGFVAPMRIEVLTGSVGAYVVVAEGYVVKQRQDVRGNRVHFGAPALHPGLYHLRVVTDGGESGVVENAIASRPFATPYKVAAVRGKWASAWRTGRRILRG
jgi:hypothetical protein